MFQDWDEKDRRTCPIAVLGTTAGVGRKALISQFLNRRFPVKHEEPAQDELRRRRRVGGEETILENRGGISSEHLEDRALDYVGFLIIYSVTSRESFDRVEKTYREMLDVRDGEPFQAVIVGNMSDLEDERQVSSDEGLELADQLECKFIETSAKLRRNVDKAFDMLFRDIFQHQAMEDIQERCESRWLNRVMLTRWRYF